MKKPDIDPKGYMSASDIGLLNWVACCDPNLCNQLQKAAQT